MSDISANFSAASEKKLPASPEWLAALAAVALMLVIAAFGGFASLTDADGDNDSVLRLTQVRDLMAGQSWFDLTQYRLGPDGGVVMHWSRLVDAPLAGLIWLARTFGASQPLAEMIAMTVWPALLLAAASWLIVRIAREVYGAPALFPAAVLGTLTLIWIGIFTPGRIDHHNFQLVLSLAMALGIIVGTFRGGLVAGCCAALSLAVGMETLPFVAVGGATAAMLYLVRGERDAPSAAGFGLGFAVAGALCFVATVPSSAWFSVACDAYSSAQAGVAVLAGLGLFAIARAKQAQQSVVVRTGAMAGLGAMIALVAISQFPQCLADPYASLDPRLKTFWLDHVVEAQSLFDTLKTEPGKFLVWYMTPLIALAVLVWRAATIGLTRGETVLAVILTGAYATSIWQIRGAQFAVPFATTVLAGWVARHRTGDGSARASLIGVLVWVASMNIAWTFVGMMMTPEDEEDAVVSSSAEANATSRSPGACYATDSYAELGKLPAGTVLAISNLGSGIITYTHHRALAGPYHRNVAGNLAVLDTLLADPEAARAAAIASGATLLAVCPGNSETKMLVREAPNSLLAQLAAGKRPSWLEHIAGKDNDLAIYGLKNAPSH